MKDAGITEEELLGNTIVEINYDELIPNNVDLSNDAKLKKDLDAKILIKVSTNG